MAFNEIKKSQTLLKDKTNTPWIVGYVSSDTDFEDYVVGKTESSRSYPEVGSLGLIFNDISDPGQGAKAKVFTKGWVYAKIAGPSSSSPMIAGSVLTGDYRSDMDWGGTIFNVSKEANLYSSKTPDRDVQAYIDAAVALEGAISAQRGTLAQAFRDHYNYITVAEGATILSLNNSIVYSVVTNKYYQLRINATSTEGQTTIDYPFSDPITPDNGAQLYYLMKAMISNVANVDGFSMYDGDRSILVSRSATVYDISLVEVSVGGQIRTHIPNSRNHLVDAPYDMFALPFNNDNLALARQLVVAAPSGSGQKKLIYDVQILPFCPIREYVDNGLTNMTVNVDYSQIEIYDEDGQQWQAWGGYMLWGLKSSATFFINQSLSMATPFALDREELKIKVSNACEKWRLVSPNYNGAFEFNVAKNGGTVNSFRVDFTYRPQVPYIHVAPVFSGLYGNVNDDARGLICNGDFSIDLISDTWTQYQIQNKNYQNIFDTNIKTLDATHHLDMVSSGISSTINAIGTGVGAGLMTGNPAVGAVAGITSFAAGTADLGIQNEKFNIQRQAAIDNFKYQLDNVKAMPDTLTKISSYNVNNKYFPIIEYYSCTEQEVKAFIEFLKYRDFALNVFTTIDTVLKDRYNSVEYVKGKLVKFSEGTHVANDVSNAIYRELDQGVYL